MVRVGIGEESPDAGVVCEGREGKLGAVKTGSVRVVNGSGSQLPDSLSQGCISEACRLARLACISPVLCGALGAYTFFLARSERPQQEGKGIGERWRKARRVAYLMSMPRAASAKPLVGPLCGIFSPSKPTVVTHTPLPSPEAETLVSFPMAAIQTMQGCWRSAAIAIGEWQLRR